MLRKIIEIDKKRCNGCGLCADACHEGAIAMVDGYATLMRDDYCDGLGDCLPVCPCDAIHFVERDTLAYDAEAVAKNNQQKLACGCPGTQAKALKPMPAVSLNNQGSCLRQWPVQIKLAPTQAPYYNQSQLLIAATCSAYAYANFHLEFINNRITLIGCPKLDNVDYSEKLTEILRLNDIASVSVVRMEVPCCSGLVQAVKTALTNSGKHLPFQVVTISTDGNILE